MSSLSRVRIMLTSIRQLCSRSEVSQIKANEPICIESTRTGPTAARRSAPGLLAEAQRVADIAHRPTHDDEKKKGTFRTVVSLASERTL